jgi:hypothetical protein
MQGPDLTPQSLRLARPNVLDPAALAIVRAPESAPYPACAAQVFPAPEARPSGRVRALSLADIADNGAFTGRMGYAHPTAAPDDRLDPSQGLRP